MHIFPLPYSILVLVKQLFLSGCYFFEMEEILVEQSARWVLVLGLLSVIAHADK